MLASGSGADCYVPSAQKTDTRTAAPPPRPTALGGANKPIRERPQQLDEAPQPRRRSRPKQTSWQPGLLLHAGNRRQRLTGNVAPRGLRRWSRQPSAVGVSDGREKPTLGAAERPSLVSTTRTPGCEHGCGACMPVAMSNKRRRWPTRERRWLWSRLRVPRLARHPDRRRLPLGPRGKSQIGQQHPPVGASHQLTRRSASLPVISSRCSCVSAEAFGAV